MGRMNISYRAFRCRDWNPLDYLYFSRIEVRMVKYELCRWSSPDTHLGRERDMHFARVRIGNVVKGKCGFVRDCAAYIRTTYLRPQRGLHVLAKRRYGVPRQAIYAARHPLDVATALELHQAHWMKAGAPCLCGRKVTDLAFGKRV